MPGLAMATVKHCFDKMGIFSIEAKRNYLLQNLERSKLSEANTIINILCWIEEKTNIIRLCSIEAKSNRLNNLCKIEQKSTGLVQNGAGSKRKRCGFLQLQIQSNQSEQSL